MVYLLDGKATVTTIYGLRRPRRAGVGQEDPELGVFGSQESKVEIVVLIAHKVEDCCAE